MKKVKQYWQLWLLTTLCILLVVLPVSPVMAAPTKTENTEALAWAETAAQAFRDSGTIDVSTAYSACLHIDLALSSTTGHLGTEIIVQVGSEAAVDDSWTTLTRFIGCVGTAVTVPLSANEAAGQTVLSATNPATAGFLQANCGKMVFLEDVNTPANSEIVYMIASEDAGDIITVLDGTTHAHVSGDDLWEINHLTDSAVGQWVIQLPSSVSQARVIFNNNYDATAATVYSRVRVTKTTGL